MKARKKNDKCVHIVEPKNEEVERKERNSSFKTRQKTKQMNEK